MNSFSLDFFQKIHNRLNNMRELPDRYIIIYGLLHTIHARTSIQVYHYIRIIAYNTCLNDLSMNIYTREGRYHKRR